MTNIASGFRAAALWKSAFRDITITGVSRLASRIGGSPAGCSAVLGRLVCCAFDAIVGVVLFNLPYLQGSGYIEALSA